MSDNGGIGDVFSYVFGHNMSCLPANGVPTGIDIMRVFFSYINVQRWTTVKSARQVGRELIAQWLHCNRQTLCEDNVVKKITAARGG